MKKKIELYQILINPLRNAAQKLVELIDNLLSFFPNDCQLGYTSSKISPMDCAVVCITMYIAKGYHVIDMQKKQHGKQYDVLT